MSDLLKTGMQAPPMRNVDQFPIDTVPQQAYQERAIKLGWVKPENLAPGQSYFTQLSPEEERQFQADVAAGKLGPGPTQDYDMRGFWKGLREGNPQATKGINPNDQQMHFTDYWKTPYHESFSKGSQYATPEAPVWNKKDQLIDPLTGRVVFDERQAVKARKKREE